MRLSAKDITALEGIAAILATELTKRITIADLVKRSQLSQGKITQGFKQLYGVTVFHYHLVKRMKRAQELITEGMQVQEVADLLGYSEPAAFTRAFKRIYPDPPSHYR